MEAFQAIWNFLQNSPELQENPLFDQSIFQLEQVIPIKQMSGGLSHRLYLIANRYVFREYVTQPASDLEINLIRHLSEVNRPALCPRIIQTWENCRLEEYIACPTPNKAEFLENFHHYLPTIHQLHGIFPMSCPFLLDRGPDDDDLWYCNPVFNQLRNWCLKNRNPEQYILDKIRLPVKARLFLDRELMKCLLNPMELIRFPQKPCHNDLHVWNFLGPEMLCDWEWGGLNYTLYDWANLANECNQTYKGKYIEYTPNPLVMPLFLEITGAKEKDFRFFQNVSHFFWGIWSHLQAQSDQLTDFNYDQYSQMRFSRISISD